MQVSRLRRRVQKQIKWFEHGLTYAEIPRSSRSFQVLEWGCNGDIRPNRYRQLILAASRPASAAQVGHRFSRRPRSTSPTPVTRRLQHSISRGHSQPFHPRESKIYTGGWFMLYDSSPHRRRFDFQWRATDGGGGSCLS
ncbi:hypothetical protein M8818_003932 [Zalaria obscura]|uniref:Uncharacterized protein n=1 Tax=Zalaria obscura TaxID=2024903 RepID=A0ACC3SD38_9PEZI